MDLSYLLTADFEAIERLVSARVEETPSLEFKRKSAPNQVELQRDDKKILGEAISGFANATGGTLVVGIGTEPYEGLDRAATLNEIEQVELVAARYRAYTNDCVSPPVEGITVRAVISGAGRGAIVIAVPQGQARPHMSRAPGHHTYFRRVMDKFVPMEAYEVEEMMRLKTAPKLRFVSELRRSGSAGGNQHFDLAFGLENVGSVTAKFPYIEYLREYTHPGVARHGLDGNGTTLWPRNDIASAGVLFAAGADQVIHPRQKLFVSKIEMQEIDEPRSLRGWALSRLSDGEEMRLRFEFGSEDHPKTAAEVAFTKEELTRFLRPE